MQRKLLFLATALLLSVVASAAFGQISPVEWYFAETSDSRSIDQVVAVRNTGSSDLEIAFTATCPCLTAKPDKMTVRPGRTRTVRLVLDPSGYSGSMSSLFLIRSNNPNLDGGRFRVHGTVVSGGSSTSGCIPCEEAAKEPYELYEQPGVYIEYFYSPRCRDCREFLSTVVPELEEEVGFRLLVNAPNIADAGALAKYRSGLSALGARGGRFPALLIGRHVLQGQREINEGLRDLALQQHAEVMAGTTMDTSSPTSRAARKRVSPLPVFATGLVDGLRPCSLVALAFLLSCLVLAGRGRIGALTIGLPYVAVVFATYVTLGLGPLQALRAAAALPAVIAVLRWVLVATLIVFSCLSLFETRFAHSVRAGDGAPAPAPGTQVRARSASRWRARTAAIICGALLVGILLSVFELAGTGDLDAPAFVHLVGTDGRSEGIPLLLTYNAGLVLPLLAVVGLALLSAGAPRLVAIRQRYAIPIEIGPIGVFVLLAVLVAVI